MFLWVVWYWWCVFIGDEFEIFRRYSFFDDNILMNFSGFVVEYSFGSFVEEKFLFFDNGDGFGDEGVVGEMIGMFFVLKVKYLF